MKKVISSEKIPIKMWLEDMDDDTLEQAKNLANLPFAFKHIAIMPDSHLGYGMPIGGVLATKKVIIPNAVGVDIGCGMCAVKTKSKDIDTNTLKEIMSEIRKAIPVGFNKHNEPQDTELMPLYDSEEENPILIREWENALLSLGTLGGGNHFIEIQRDTEGYLWIMIHSGSRNLGLKVASYYNDIAVKLNERYYSKVTKDKQLAFLPLNTEIGQRYLSEMNYCVDYALANRSLMMDRIINIFKYTIDMYDKDFEQPINIAHNYASVENHFGENVIIHRKGATLATKETVGIIPSSQGTKSYIVKGLGNAESFNSCSHGAGRKLGRKQAKRNLDLDEELKKMGNIIHSIRDNNDLDEAVGSYKDIDVVMENQKDLVEILVELTPLAVIKG